MYNVSTLLIIILDLFNNKQGLVVKRVGWRKQGEKVKKGRKPWLNFENK